MKTYDYTKFKRCFLGGNFDGNFDEMFSSINNGLKKPFEKEIHPKEVERQERLKRRAEEMRNARRIAHDRQIPGIGGLHPEMPMQEVNVPNPHHIGEANRLGEATYDDGRIFKKKMKMPSRCYSYNDSVIIVAGSCGFGTKELSYFEKKLSSMNNVLAENNCHLLFVRGNNEDPSYFDEEKINFSNIKTLVSNCIVAFDGFNCLCIGGGLSMDREWRKNKSKDFGRIYWENEDISIDWDDMKKTIENTDIACVISHQIPTFISSIDSNNRWVKHDSKLVSEMVNSRLNMDLLYTEFVKANKKPFVWWNTYPNSPNNYRVNDILFKHESSYCTNSLDEIVFMEFNVNLVKEDDEKHSSIVSRLSKMMGEITSIPSAVWYNDANDVTVEFPDEVIVGDNQAEGIRPAINPVFNRVANDYAINEEGRIG